MVPGGNEVTAAEHTDNIEHKNYCKLLQTRLDLVLATFLKEVLQFSIALL